MQILRTDPVLRPNPLPAAGQNLTSRGQRFGSESTAPRPSYPCLLGPSRHRELGSEIGILTYFPRSSVASHLGRLNRVQQV